MDPAWSRGSRQIGSGAKLYRAIVRGNWEAMRPSSIVMTRGEKKSDGPLVRADQWLPDRFRQPADAAKDATGGTRHIISTLPCAADGAQPAMVAPSSVRFEHLSLYLCRHAVRAPPLCALAPFCHNAGTSLRSVRLLEVNPE